MLGSLRHNWNSFNRFVRIESVAEVVTTLMSFVYTFVSGDLTSEQLLVRVPISLACIYIARLLVFVVLEGEGYFLANVLYRSTWLHIAVIVNSIVGALLVWNLGDELVAVSIGNSTSA